MNARSKKTLDQTPLGTELCKVANAPFSVPGHLWLICHFGGYVAARKLANKSENAARRAFLTATKGFLDEVFERRSGESFLAVMRELKPVLSDIDSIAPSIDFVTSCAVRVVASIDEDAKPVSLSKLKRVLHFVQESRDERNVSIWLKHSWAAFQDAEELVADANLGRVDESKVETSVDALVPTRYVIALLEEQKRREIPAFSATDSTELICEHLAATRFSFVELLEIHDAFSECVGRLPSVDINRAAELIGVSVDRVHRMAALREIDSFFIRRKIPKGEVSIKKKSQERDTEDPVALSKDIKQMIVGSFQTLTFSIPELLQVQELLEKRINRSSFPLKSAVEQLGYSEVYVHAMLRKGKLRSFGFHRLIPESEAFRLQRDPTEPHQGRPRISEVDTN